MVKAASLPSAFSTVMVSPTPTSWRSASFSVMITEPSSKGTASPVVRWRKVK